MTQSSIPAPSSISMADALGRASGIRVKGPLPLREGRMGICSAAMQGDAQRISRCLGDGEDPFSKDADGRSALQLAKASGSAEAQSILRQAMDKAFMDAVRDGDRSKALFALMEGADVDAQDHEEFGETALMVSIVKGDIEMSRVLLSLGADPAIKDCLDMDSHDWARREGHHAIIELLGQERP